MKEEKASVESFGTQADYARRAAYFATRKRIDRAALTYERRPEDVTLTVVSKTFSADEILPLLEAGHETFGENRVQEAYEKWGPLRERFPDVRLSLIGPLQTNKAREALAFFDVIETLDRVRLAEALRKEMDRSGKSPVLFVQINTGEEPQKAGVAPREADAFLSACSQTYGLRIDGLMCVPPQGAPPSAHFGLLRKIAQENGISTLSMGMSNDFEAAIQLGATHVRVGSAIFGAR